MSDLHVEVCGVVGVLGDGTGDWLGPVSSPEELELASAAAFSAFLHAHISLFLLALATLLLAFSVLVILAVTLFCDFFFSLSCLAVELLLPHCLLLLLYVSGLGFSPL